MVKKEKKDKNMKDKIQNMDDALNLWRSLEQVGMGRDLLYS